MRKRVLFLLLILCSHSVFSQNIINTLPSAYLNVQNSYSIVDEESQEYYIILQTSDSVKAYQYSKKHELKNNIQLFNLKKEYDALIGTFVTNGVLKLVFTKKHKDFTTLTLNFNDTTSSMGVIDIKVKGKILTLLQKKEHLYLLSVPARGAGLNVYVIDADLVSQMQTIAFEKGTFKDFRDEPITFSELTKVLTGMDYIRPIIATIKDQNSTSLLSNANPTKLYTYSNSNKITITLDKYSSKTYILDIDLDTYAYKSKAVDKPVLETLFGTKSNSLLFEDKLFQLTANNEAFICIIKSYPSLEILQTYKVTKDENISFKNSPINLKGGSLETSRNLDNTAQFLRKITADYPGIAIHKHDDEVQVTFGTEIMLKQVDAGTIALAIGGGLIGAMIGAGLSSSFGEYESGVPTRKIKFVGKFDEDFNHLPGTVKTTIPKTIPDYFTSSKEIKALTVFTLDERTYIGYFHKEQNKYHISGLN